jgi:hypothetical protein
MPNIYAAHQLYGALIQTLRVAHSSHVPWSPRGQAPIHFMQCDQPPCRFARKALAAYDGEEGAR